MQSTLQLAGFLLVSILLLAAAVLAVVQTVFDFPALKPAQRVGSVLAMVAGAVVILALVAQLHANAPFLDTFAWFAHLTVVTAALLAQILLLRSTLKSREADQHEKQRSPERYQPSALRA